jgi:actin-like ATPase involved in cell morphogenesis
VREWEVPVEVGGRRLALTGDVTWVPEPAAAARVGAARPAGQPRSTPPYVLGGGAAAVLAVAVLVLRRVRRAQPGP